MICERCGNEMSDNAVICPICGTANTVAKIAPQPPTSYGQYPVRGFGEAVSHQQDFASYPPPPSAYAAPPQQNVGTTTFYNSAQIAAPPSAPGTGATTHSNKNDSALIAEIILSLFGLFGVGWLIAGETTTGIILLICSVLVYWPVMIGGTIFTLGIGLLCLGPIAIGAIITNILLLNNVLKRKAAGP